LPPQPKSHIKGLPAVVHGGIGFAVPEIGMARNGLLDFSTSCNPFRPPFTVYSAFRSADIQRYPDPDSRLLVRALSQKLGVPAAQIIAGNGSTEVIRLATTAFFDSSDTVVLASSTYGEYELASSIAGARVVKYRLTEANDFQLHTDSFIAFAKEQRPTGIFLCNPNNPTGQYLLFNDVVKIVQAFPDTLIILDEAYVAFTDCAWDSLKLCKSGNLLIVRSMTKDYALPGLRLGYAVASTEIVSTLRSVRPPWNVSGVAQSAGIEALSCNDFLVKSKERIRSSRDYLVRELQSMGFRTIPTGTNFFIFRVENACFFQKQLLEKGFLVRDCTSFGLPDYVRVAPRSKDDCRKLIKAIAETAGETG
jgi:histidinol-phosphate aminotransferase